MLATSIVLSILFGYIFAKLLTSKYCDNNEALHLEIKRLKELRESDRRKYRERICMLNDAFNNYKGVKK